MNSNYRDRERWFDAGFVGVRLCITGWPAAYEFYVRPDDLDSVIEMLRRHGLGVHVAGREECMPKGVATLGGYPTGRDHVKPGKRNILNRIMSYEPHDPPMRVEDALRLAVASGFERL